MSWILSIILALSLFLRVGLLNQIPPELFGDEIDVGYQAYSLLHTGRDLYRHPLPFYLSSLAEARAPLLMYMTVPSVAAFGLNEWGVRLPEAIWGSLAPTILFLLVYQTTKSKSISLLSSLSLSLMPWHILYSRAAFEVVIMLDLIMLGTLLFLKRRFELCVLTFALAMYTYSTAILFVPLWIIALLITSKKVPPFRSVLLFILILIPLVYYVVAGPARNRFSLLTLNQDPDRTKTLLILRQKDQSPWSRIFLNQYESTLHTFWDNYLLSFSSEFLFVRGDPSARQSLQVIGELLPFSFPFLIVGLWWLVSKKQWLWLAWLGLGSLPASLTVGGGNHATRLFLQTAPWAVATGAGAAWLWSRFRPLAILIGLLCLGQIVWAGYYYTVHYSRESWRWWHVGFRSAMQEVARQAPNYSRIFINNTYEPALPRFLFWTKYPPATFHRKFTTDQPEPEIVPHYNGFTLDGKYFFGSFTSPDWTKYLLPNSLYVISQRDNVGGDWDWRKSPPDNIRVLFASTDPSGFPVLYLITRK